MADSTTGDRLHEAALRQGTVVGGKFVIKRFLAQGGMGRVYVAEQQPMGRKVALKIMRRDLANDDRAVRRFFREAVAVSKLQHPNTVTLFDYGESESGSLYIAMEYLDGLSLKDVLAADPTLPVERVTRIVAQIALSLAEAHRKGVVHRDLKPDNIFISSVDGRSDFVKVIDFGIAHLQTFAIEHGPESRITQAGFVCGTPEYMSPEQARGDEIDARADLYSLGVILFEMLEGKLPYDGTTPLAIVLKHQTDPVPGLSERHPRAMTGLVERLMAKEPRDRPTSAEQLIRELSDALPDAGALTGFDLEASSRPGAGTIPAAEAVFASDSGRAPDTREMAETLAEADSLGSDDSETAVDASSHTGAGPPSDTDIAERKTIGRWVVVALVAAIIIAALLLVPPSAPRGRSVVTGSGSGAPGPIATSPAGDERDGEVSEVAGSGPGTGDGLAATEPPTPLPVAITLVSEPPRARLHLDGLYVGLTPLDVELPPDTPHEVVLALDDFVDLQTTLSVSPEQTGQTLPTFVLEPRPALITITTEPDDVEVIDVGSGESWGETALTREVPRSDEPIVLRFERSRYQSTERTVEPNQPQIVLHVELRRERRSEPRQDDDDEDDDSSPFGPPVD